MMFVVVLDSVVSSVVGFVVVGVLVVVDLTTVVFSIRVVFIKADKLVIDDV